MTMYETVMTSGTKDLDGTVFIDKAFTIIEVEKIADEMGIKLSENNHGLSSYYRYVSEGGRDAAFLWIEGGKLLFEW